MKFITIVDSNLDLVLLYCKWNEDTFGIDALTGISFTKTKDGNYVLGLVFQDDKAWDESMTEARLYKFNVIVDKEEDWASFATISDFLILGNFSYKMMSDDVK